MPSDEKHCLSLQNIRLRWFVYQLNSFNGSCSHFSTARFCTNPVGMQNGKIKNGQITASSMFNQFHAPWLARLHRAKHGRYIGSWSSRHNNHNQWLQVDLGKTMKVTGINTQGRQDLHQWVTAYYVFYSLDGMYFAKVKHWWNYVKVGGWRCTAVFSSVLTNCTGKSTCG